MEDGTLSVFVLVLGPAAIATLIGLLVYLLKQRHKG